MLDIKAENPTDLTIYSNWATTSRYQKTDLIQDTDSAAVYECSLESFCQFAPTSVTGKLGWSLTQYRVPSASEAPPSFYYTTFDGVLTGDIIRKDDAATGFKCTDALKCREGLAEGEEEI